MQQGLLHCQAAQGAGNNRTHFQGIGMNPNFVPNFGCELKIVVPTYGRTEMNPVKNVFPL
jgi:hypothetical protein